MRFMIIMKATDDTEAGIMPPAETFEAMGKFNDELINAGVLLAGDGLHPTSRGARIRREGGRHVVLDGPFSESKELIAGYWLIQAKDKEEALSWTRRIPLNEGEEVELRRVYEAADFADVLPPEEIAREQAWRDARQKPVAG